jgi:glycine/D-amino acid oxidase-like deaminating enzyme
VKLIFDADVEKFVLWNAKTKENQVKGIKLRGKDELITCDAVVLCAGSFIARLLKENFDLICPVVPVKGYSFDIPTDTEHSKINLQFKDRAFVATRL